MTSRFVTSFFSKVPAAGAAERELNGESFPLRGVDSFVLQRTDWKDIAWNERGEERFSTRLSLWVPYGLVLTTLLGLGCTDRRDPVAARFPISSDKP